MTQDDLKGMLDSLDMKPVELASLLNVTPRAINLWLAGEREVPGPTEAYLALLLSLPPALRAKEKLRLQNKGEKDMPEGMYLATYTGTADAGFAVLVFQHGKIFGMDVGRVAYDGTYKPTGTPGQVAIHLKLSVPAGVPLVMGVPAKPVPYSFEIDPQVINTKGASSVPVVTPFGTVNAKLERLRDIPDA